MTISEQNWNLKINDSLGGFIIEHLDRLPEVGDHITTEDQIRLVVEKLAKTVSKLFMCICLQKQIPDSRKTTTDFNTTKDDWF